MRLLLGVVFLYASLSASNLFSPLPKEIKYDKNIVNLGKELFYDTLLSKNNDLSCFSCHNNYGADTNQFSIGDKGKKGFINTPSVFNLPYKVKYFWNGRSETLKDQVTNGPLYAKHEMASDKNTILFRLSNSQKYHKLFKLAYKKEPNFELMIDAIVKFQETLISSNSKFDKYLRGEVKLSSKEQKGLDLFISYGCVSCHNGINLGGNSYQKFGSVIENNDTDKKWEDKYAITKKEEDKMVFIVPSLRNVEKTAPYFHSGDVMSLKDAIRMMGYYNIGIMLEEKEIEEIEAFLNTLTGNIPKTFFKSSEH